jgi:flagellar hook-associated protein 1 FlgK
MYSNVIPGYQNNLDSFVNQLMTSVNTIHKQGYTLDNPPKTNVSFFSGYSNGVLSINSDILSDPQKIAVSKDGTAANGDLAISISDIATQKVINGTTLGDYYTSLVSKIGSDKSAADQNTQSFQSIVQQLQQRKASVSGVSVDEEMTNILKYQRAYTASAKLIKAADDMLQILLNAV